MSDRFHPCNLCSLKAIKADAKRREMKVVERPSDSGLGGVDVYVVPPDIPIPEHISGGTEEREGDEFHKKYFVAWFWEVPATCCC